MNVLANSSVYVTLRSYFRLFAFSVLYHVKPSKSDASRYYCNRLNFICTINNRNGIFTKFAVFYLCFVVVVFSYSVSRYFRFPSFQNATILTDFRIRFVYSCARSRFARSICLRTVEMFEMRVERALVTD